MAWFTKETETEVKRENGKVKLIRKETPTKAGRVAEVVREKIPKRKVYVKEYNGDTITRGAAPDYDKLKTQYYREHPEKRPSAKLKRAGTKLASIAGQMADNYQANMADARRASKRSKRGGRPTRYSTRDNYNPFGTMFDTGLEPYPQAKKRAKTTKKRSFGTVDIIDSNKFFR